MPVVKKVSGGQVYVRAADRQFETGDQADVSPDAARYLVEERGDFEYAAEQRDGSSEDSPEGPAGGEETPRDAGTDTTGLGVGGGDFSADDWLDHSYGDRAEAVRDGKADAHLDEIGAAETSETVTDAVQARRAELGDGEGENGEGGEGEGD